jgi:predicted nucleotidyltransferase
MSARDMTRLDLLELAEVVVEQPYPLLFATVSGAHLYGFPSRDSDVDLRGVHVLPAAAVVGLRTGPETLSRIWNRDGAELDLVTHDVAKFFRLLLRRNGYVLEQLLSPLVVTSTPEHAELVALAPATLTRHHAWHYRGFANTQWRLFERSGELKPLLYTLRVLLTGIHLMRSGEVLADLPELARAVPDAPPYVADLVAAKRAGEHDRLDGTPGLVEPQTVSDDVARLGAVLNQAHEDSDLPDAPRAEPALHDLLVRLRLRPT